MIWLFNLLLLNDNRGVLTDLDNIDYTEQFSKEKITVMYLI